MNKFAVILTLGIIGFGLTAISQPAQALYPTELVKNGGFELGDNGNWSGSTEAIVDGGVAWRSGTHGLKIQGDCLPGPCPRIISLRQDVPLPANATDLQISLWFVNHLSLQFSITVVNAANPSDIWITSSIPDSSGWAKLSADLTARRGGTARIIIHGEEWLSPFYAYVDDVSILANFADTTAPTTTFTSTPAAPNGANGYFTTIPSIVLNATDDPLGSGLDTTYFRWDNDADAVYAGPLTPAQGTHTLSFYSIDKNGNVEPPTIVTFKVDSVKPSVSSPFLNTIPDGSNGWYKTAPSISLAASDAVSGVSGIQYRWNNGSAVASSGVVVAPEGVNVLHYWATDTAGNVGDEATLTVKVDSINPTITLIGGAGAQTVNTAKGDISGAVSDGGSGMSSVTVNGTAVSITSGNHFSTTLDLSKGANTITIVVTDLAGRTTLATKTITYEPIKVLGAVTKAPVIRVIRRNVHAATTSKAVRQKFTIAGKNFSKNARVWIGKVKPVQTVYKNSTTIVIVVRLKKLRAGTYNVTVKNPDGLAATLKKGLTVTRA